MQQQQQQPPLLFEAETQAAKQFVQQYYNLFDANKAQAVTSLFKDASTVCFEGTSMLGANQYLQRINELGIPPTAQHRVVTVDCQPSCVGSGALVVFVTGEYVGQQLSGERQCAREQHRR